MLPTPGTKSGRTEVGTYPADGPGAIECPPKPVHHALSAEYSFCIPEVFSPAHICHPHPVTSRGAGLGRRAPGGAGNGQPGLSHLGGDCGGSRLSAARHHGSRWTISLLHSAARSLRPRFGARL